MVAVEQQNYQNASLMTQAKEQDEHQWMWRAGNVVFLFLADTFTQQIFADISQK